MSGGRYDYLHVWADNLHELAGRLHHLRQMSERLAALPYARDAARDTARLLALLDDLAAEVERRGPELADVWHAVEWWDSGDSLENQVREAAAQYRTEQTGREGEPMKCRNCETGIIADAEGKWMHVPSMADRPCDDPARPTELDAKVLEWLEDLAERWFHNATPAPPPEGVRETWIELPVDDPDLTSTMRRFRAVLDDGTALYVTRDFETRIIEEAP